MLAVNKKKINQKKHIKNLNKFILGDYEIWDNFIQPIKNGTIPNISKKKWLDNSFNITISFPLAAVDKDRFMKLHKLYSFNHSLTEAKVDYRMKLPKNPHFVRRTLFKNDGKTVDIFTVAEEVIKI